MTESDGYVLVALFALPLACAVLLMLVPSRERSVLIVITGLTSLAMFGMSVYIFWQYDYHSTQQFQGVVAWTWLENVGFLGDRGIQFKVGLDGIGAAMVLLTEWR